MESLHCGGGVSGIRGEGSRAGVRLVEMLCASPEKEGAETEQEKKRKRHYIKTR